MLDDVLIVNCEKSQQGEEKLISDKRYCKKAEIGFLADLADAKTHQRPAAICNQ